MQRDAARMAQQAKQALTHIVQFHHIAECRETIILSIKGDKTGMAAVADVNGGNRRRTVGNRLPQVNLRQLLAGTSGQRNRPPIKAWMFGGVNIRRLYQVHRKAARRQLRNSQRQRGAGHAAADNNHAHS